MSERIARQAEIARRLTQPLGLEDGRLPGIFTRTLYTLSALVIGVVIWASIAQVREFSIAQGQIVPTGQIESIQHLEGGIVGEILVHEGDVVSAQQPLIKLRPEAATSERDQFQARRASLKLQLLRLEAQIEGVMPDFGKWGSAYPDLARQMELLLINSEMHRHQENSSLASRVAQKQGEIATLRAGLDAAQSQLEVQKELLEIQERLVATGTGARKNLLEAKIQMQRAEAEVISLKNKIDTAANSVAEAESNMRDAEAKEKQKLSEERVKAASDLHEVEQQLVKLADRFDRLVIRAPSNGIIHELSPKSVGEVIRAGDLVARIVPTGRELVAEVRIDPKDVSHIHAGADADLRLTAYESSVYGPVRGKVQQISASTFMPPPSQATAGQGSPSPYYKATIRLLEDRVSHGSMHFPIAPGMVLQAQIKTGTKSVTRYLLKPVFNSLDVAFSER